MAHPPLTKIQRDVLRTVRYEPREERWSHTTLGYLRSLGLVTSEAVETAVGRPSRSIYRWTVTDLGIHVFGSNARAPVPLTAPAS